MARGRDFVPGLVDAVKRLFEGGVTDPSAEEIADEYFHGVALCDEIVASVRDRLHRVRDALVADGYIIHLTSLVYYNDFRKGPPQNEEDARRCIPLGLRAEGLRRAASDDIMWMTAEAQNILSSTAKLDHAADRVVAAHKGGYLSLPEMDHLWSPARASCARQYPAAAPQLALPFGISADGQEPMSITEGHGVAVTDDRQPIQPPG